MKWMYGTLFVVATLLAGGTGYWIGYVHGFSDSERRYPPVPEAMSDEMKEALLHRYRDWKNTHPDE